MSNAKRMTFYATPQDQAMIEEILALRPHYSFNFAVREGLRLLRNALKAADATPPPPSKRFVEYDV